MTGENRLHAIVVGTGVAGLAAAAELSRLSWRVTLLDADELPDQVRPRGGVPQGAHLHGLLAAGGRGIERLFPGITTELEARGAVPFDPGRNMLVHQLGGFRIPFDSGMTVHTMTRPLLEDALRRRVVAMPDLRIVSSTRVVALTGNRQLVTGVRTGGGDVHDADLVVDASGRHGGTAGWLSDLGATLPAVDEVVVRVRYGSVLLRRRAGDLPPGVVCPGVVQQPPGKRGGVATAVEDDRWLVTLVGWHDDYPPTDLTGYREYAASLPHPMIAELLARAEPIGRITTFAFRSSRRWRVEHQRDVPGGYVAIGDAVCSINPLYGQGVSIAILQAAALGRCLAGGPPWPEVVRAFYAETARIVDGPWKLAAGIDFLHAETQGRRPRAMTLRRWYGRQMARAAQVAPDVHSAMLNVQHMLSPLSTLAKPRLVARVLRAARRGRLAGRLGHDRTRLVGPSETTT